MDTYFTKVNGNGLSEEFKNLILSFFQYDPEKRPTMQQIKAHPWMNKPGFNLETTRANLLNELARKSAVKQ